MRNIYDITYDELETFLIENGEKNLEQHKYMIIYIREE